MFGGGGETRHTGRGGDFPGLSARPRRLFGSGSTGKQLEELKAGRRRPQPGFGPRTVLAPEAAPSGRWAAAGAPLRRRAPQPPGSGGRGSRAAPGAGQRSGPAGAAFRRCLPQRINNSRLQSELPSARKQELEKVAWHVGADPDQRDGKAALFVCGVYRGSLKKGPKIHFGAELQLVSCFLLRGAKRVWYERSLDGAGGNVAFAQWRVRDKCFADDCTSNVSGSSHPRIPSHHYAKRMISQ